MLAEHSEKLSRNVKKDEVVRYLASTAFSAMMTVLLPTILHEVFRIAEDIAVAVSLATALVVNFLIMRHFVFRSAGHAGKQFAVFVLSSFSFRLAEFILFMIAFKILGIHYIIALLVSLSISSIVKFFFHRTVTFPNRHS